MRSVVWVTGSMKRSPDHGASIRRRLLALLVVPATVALVAGTLADFLSSTGPIRDVYDQELANDAVALSLGVRARSSGIISVRIPEEAETLLRTDPADKVYFGIVGPDGALLAGDADLPQAQAGKHNPAFQTAVYRSEPIRLATYRRTTRLGVITTTIAETLNKRAAVRWRLWSTSVAIDLFELICILGFVWLGISIALKPLQALGDQIEKRSPRDLEPLQPESVPVEVRTVVNKLNGLLATIAESSRAERQFLESAAHQLRTPLAGLLAQLELLVADETERTKQERLAFTLEAARRLSRTTQQLLALSRSEHAAYMYTEARPVDLADIARESTGAHVTRASAAGIDLGAELQAATVSGVAWLLAEAVNNLLDNAITYTPAGGSITVRTGTRGDAPYLEVVDTGIGIPPAEREQVTERFYRGQQSLGTGSGLGLSIVADVARRHDATLTVSAGADGRGTCARLDFRPPSSAPAPQPPP